MARVSNAQVSDLVRTISSRERAVAKATRLRLGKLTTPATDATLRTEMADLIATMTAALLVVPDAAVRSAMEEKLASLKAHLARMMPAAHG
jgi:hypothetical protein